MSSGSTGGGGGGVTDHDALTGVSSDDHHTQVHVLSSADHIASGLTIGNVLRATGPSTFTWQAIQDIDLPASITRGGVIRKTANQTLTAVAQTAITDMSFLAQANSTYFFFMRLNITTSTGTSPTSNFAFTGPASPTAVAISRRQDTSTSIEVTSVIASFTAFGAGAQVANTGVGFSGIIQTAAASGTVQLTVARGGTTPSMVVVAGSHGFFIKVA